MTRSAIAAEIRKLVTLPAIGWTALATTVVGAVVASVHASIEDAVTNPVVESMPLLRAGLVLIGVLSVGHEYASGGMRRAILGVPNRFSLAAAKVAAALAVAVIVAGAAVGAAVVVSILRGGPSTDAATAIGAVSHLALIAAIAQAVTFAVRGVVPALTANLAFLFIVSPLLADRVSSRWLPDRAGAALYSDTPLDTATGAVVLVGWTVTALVVGAVVLHRRDA